MTVREAALKTLNSIFDNGQYSNLAVDQTLRGAGNWTAEDRSFYTRLVYGVIEKKITLDYYIDALTGKKADRIEPYVRNILRMGLYQILSMQSVPDHAAVNESVKLGKKSSAGFINAVLRAFLRKRDSLPLPAREENVLRYLSVRYSAGEPLCRKLIVLYGEEKAEKILQACNAAPDLSIRVNVLKTDREALLDRLNRENIRARAGNLPTQICVAELPVGHLASLEEGLFFVQDEASQWCVRVMDAQSGDKVLDMCSAPGSKSFGMAMDMQNSGSILAMDLYENKMPLITASAERLGIGIIEAKVQDGRVFDPALAETADRVLCDVPCSGFGVMAKKPELRYKAPEESEELTIIQEQILENASRYVKKGGVLVYSTCTIFPEENEERILSFLKTHPEFELAPFSVRGKETPGYLTLLPDETGTDGFFISRMKKKKE